MNKVVCLLGAACLAFGANVFAQEAAAAEEKTQELNTGEGTASNNASGESQEASQTTEPNEDDEIYLSIEDQEALLDRRATEVMEANVTEEHKADTGKGITRPYIVRIEVYARPHTAYIPAGDLPLEQYFFSWSHDGRKHNGYAVFMYHTTKDESAIKTPKGAVRLYAKSFRTIEDASKEIQGTNTEFHRFITYKPVIDQMLETLQSDTNQVGSK